ncbi:hypothetical protein RUND412_001479 [Rhizina undulata]
MCDNTSNIWSSDHVFASLSSDGSSDQQAFIDVILLELSDDDAAKEAARRKILASDFTGAESRISRADIRSTTFVTESGLSKPEGYT